MQDFEIEEEDLDEESMVMTMVAEESDETDVEEVEFEPEISSRAKSKETTKSKSINPLSFSSSDYLPDSFKIPAPVISRNESITKATINRSMSSLRLSESESSKMKSISTPKSSTKINIVRKPVKRLSVSLRDASVAETSLLSNSRLSKTVHVPGTSKHILKCETCFSVFSNQSGFTRHKCNNTSKSNISSQSDSALSKCDQCEKVCISLVGLKRHKTLKHKEMLSNTSTSNTQTLATPSTSNSQPIKDNHEIIVDNGSQDNRVKKSTRKNKGK